MLGSWWSSWRVAERPTEEGFIEGRTFGDAPDVDPIIRVCGEGGEVGQIRKVRVTASDGYDLIGTLSPKSD